LREEPERAVEALATTRSSLTCSELREQSAALSEVAAVFPLASASDDRLGEERPDLPGCRRDILSPRSPERGMLLDASHFAF